MVPYTPIKGTMWEGKMGVLMPRYALLERYWSCQWYVRCYYENTTADRVSSPIGRRQCGVIYDFESYNFGPK